MRSPLDLCEKLELRPTAGQRALLVQLRESPRVLEVPDDERNEATRAVGIAAIWRVLSTQGSKCIALAPTEQLGVDFMDFIEGVTMKRSPELAQACHFPRWNVVEFGPRMGWELRLMPNVHALVAERAPEAIVSIILGAGNSEPRFVEACKALEEHSTHPKNTLIRVW